MPGRDSEPDGQRMNHLFARLSLVLLLIGAPAAAQDEISWDQYLDYAYVFSSAEQPALRARLEQYAQEAGAPLGSPPRAAADAAGLAERAGARGARAATRDRAPAAVPGRRQRRRARPERRVRQHAEAVSRPAREPLLVPLHPRARRARARPPVRLRGPRARPLARRGGAARDALRDAEGALALRVAELGLRLVAAVPVRERGAADPDQQPADGHRQRPRPARRRGAAARRPARGRPSGRDPARGLVEGLPRPHRRAARTGPSPTPAASPSRWRCSRRRSSTTTRAACWPRRASRTRP